MAGFLPAIGISISFCPAAALRAFLADFFAASVVAAVPPPMLFRSASIRSTTFSPRGRAFAVMGLGINPDRRREADDDNDPPALRYKDARHLATTRLGPYAERHLGWSRLSVLNRLGDTADTLGGQLADANRAARAAFTKGNPEVFKETAERAEKLSNIFLSLFARNTRLNLTYRA